LGGQADRLTAKRPEEKQCVLRSAF